MKRWTDRQVLTRQIYISESDVLDLYAKLLEILGRERKSFNEWVYEQIKDYVAKHGSGNPAFRLDKWIENSEFIAFPTLGEPANPRLLRKMNRKTLYELVQNAKSYVDYGEYLLKCYHEHERYHGQGIKDSYCPYCREDDHG